MQSKTILILTIVVIGLLSALAEQAQAQVLQQWYQRYNGPGDSLDNALASAVDGLGNVYVTGPSFGTGTFYDYATIKYNSSGTVQWIQRYSGTAGGSLDMPAGIAVDSTGNVFVTGYSFGNGTGFDIATIKYNSSGVQQWVQRYNVLQSSNEYGRSIVLDHLGNVYVTGSAPDSAGISYDYLTIKYNSSGVLQWAQRYNGTGNGSDDPHSIAVDGSGNVYLTGESAGIGTGLDYATVKYNSSGVFQWAQRYNGPGNLTDQALGIAVDGSGNVFVTGQSTGSGTNYDYTTIKYSSAGTELWSQRYNGPGNNWDAGYSITLDNSGSIYVTGRSWGSGSSYDYATIKYNTSGSQVWAQRYNGPGNNNDLAYSVTVDNSGFIYVTGQSVGTGTAYDAATIKYSSAGVQLWAQRFTGPGSRVDCGNALAINARGDVFVTGYSQLDTLSTEYDFLTLKYIQTPFAPSNLSASAVSQSKINLQWADNSANEYGFKIERSTNSGANWIFRDSVGSNITAYSDSGLASNTIYHYRIFAYNLAGSSAYSNTASDTTFNLTGIISNSELPKEYKLYDNYPNPFNPSTNIKFSIPNSGLVKLAVYDILGKEAKVLVNESMNAGTYNVSFDASGLASGIYFYRIEVRQAGSTASGFTGVKKMMLIK